MKHVAVNNPRTSYFVGGAEMVSIEHAKNMSDLGYAVSFFTINPTFVEVGYFQQYLSFKQEYSEKITFVEIVMDEKSFPIYKIKPGEDRARWNTESLFYERELFSALNNSGVIFDFMISYFNLDTLIISKSRIKQNVLYLCGIPPDENRFRTSFLAMYDKILAITEETKNYWSKYTNQAISVVTTGVDTARFIPSEFKDESIVFIGRLIKRKGCDIFLRSISQLIKNVRLDNKRVIVVGDGPQDNALKKLSLNLGLEKTIDFVGRQNNPEQFLSKASICVSPSRSGEGLQGVILESMACGACVLASDSIINKALLDKKRGVIINPDDPESIADVIQKLLNEKSTLTTIGNNARKFVVKEYNWKNITEKLLQEILK